MPHTLVRLSALLLALGAGTTGASAQSTPPVQKGTYGDWQVFTFREKGGPVCYIANRTPRREGGSDRAPGHIMVTHRPGEKRLGVVSVVPGYAFKDRSTALVTVGGRSYTLYTQGDTAWAKDSDDAALVQVLRTSGTLEFTGQPQSGGALADTYSLGGTAAALDALDKACAGGTARKTQKKPGKK
jgi:invasion protein IalB